MKRLFRFLARIVGSRGGLLEPEELERRIEERTRVLRESEARYRTLVETMNEGVCIIDSQGRISFFNRRMGEIVGCEPAEAVGRDVFSLYDEENQRKLNAELERRRGGESSTYELDISTDRGEQISVLVAGTPWYDRMGAYQGSFAVITDIEHQKDVEREIQRESEERARLFEQERKTSAQLATVNEVGKIAMASLDPDRLMSEVAEAIQRNFDYYDVSLFLLDRAAGEVFLIAQAGAYRGVHALGYRQRIGEGIVGWVAEKGEYLLANDVSKEPRYLLAFPEEERTCSELCVPIRVGSDVVGLIDVQSTQVDAFDDADVASLHTVADQIARAMENARLYRETERLKELNELIVDSIPSPVLLLDGDLNIILVNRAYSRRIGKEFGEIVWRPLQEVAPPDSPLLLSEVAEQIRAVADTHIPSAQITVRSAASADPGRMLNIHITHVEAVGMPHELLIVMEDVTETVEKAYSLSMLRELGQMMEGIRELDRLFYAILTGVTAGPALGFNRAILLLTDASGGTLEGKMGMGPGSPEDASRIWAQIADRPPTLEDLLQEYDRLPDKSQMPLFDTAREIRISLTDTEKVPVLSVVERRAFNITDAANDPRIRPEFLSLVGANEFACVPVIAEDRAIGVLLADNLYSGRPISDEQVEFLSIFANHSALAIQNVETHQALEDKVAELEEAYRKLECAQDELVRSERLSTMGEMSARVAHEIRNPLATIGGFARSIRKNPAPDRVERNTKIIVEEVERLERILAETMDFVRPAKPNFERQDVNVILRDTYLPMEEGLKTQGVRIVASLDPELLLVWADADQLKQVFLNVVRNAVQAMPGDGEIRINTTTENGVIVVEISDSGEGVSAEHLEHLFSPFFTTKTYGTGLGLAVCRKIVQDHGGEIEAHSRVGEGTMLRVRLPAYIQEEGR